MKKLSILLLSLLTLQAHLNADELVDRRTFFPNVMGMDEVPFQDSDAAKRAAIQWNNDEQVFYLKRTDGTLFRAGKFSILNIAQLRQATENLQKRDKGTFSVLEAKDALNNKAYYDHFDVGANQAKPENNDAVFQVASNFNALELLSADDKMVGLYTYLGDLTQGPFASFSAAPGLILRHYYQFYEPGTQKDPKDWQQHAILDGSRKGRLWTKADQDKQINFLEDTDIAIRNAYVSFNLKNPALVNDFAVEKIKIGWHGNIQVTSGLMPARSEYHTRIDRDDQFVNQVFTAGVDFGVENSPAYKNNPKAVAIAQAALDAAYEGTLRAAALYGKKKVFLTMIGGGVFKNQLEWIGNAIKKMQQFIVDSGLEVTLIIFDSTDKRFAGQFEGFRASMLQMTEETGGTYKQYSPENPGGILLPLKEDVEKREEPKPNKEEDKIVALLKEKMFYDVRDILQTNNFYFNSVEDGQRILTKAGHYDVNNGRIRRHLDPVILEFVRAPQANDDSLRDALNNSPQH